VNAGASVDEQPVSGGRQLDGVVARKPDDGSGGGRGLTRASGVVLAGLTAVSFFNYADRMAVSVLIEPIKKSLLLSDTQAGLITGFAFALFYAVMGVPIARLADRGNKPRILVMCFALWSAMTALSGAATSFLTLFLFRLMVGVGEAGCIPASFAIISDRFSARQRPLAISIFQSGGKLGVALGMAGAGLAGDQLGWRMALVLVGSAGLPIALIVGVSLRGVDAPVGPGTRSIRAPVARVATIVKFPGFGRLIVAISLASFATYGISQWLPAFYVRSYGASLTGAGLWIGMASGVGGMAGTLGGGFAAEYLLRRHPDWDLWLPAASYTLAAPLFIAAFLSPTLVMSATFYLAAFVAATSGGGVALAAFQRFTEPGHRATANAVMLMISALTGVGLGPVAVGFGSDLLNSRFGTESLRWALTLCSLAFLAAGVCFHLTSRRSKSAKPVTV
jgi:predicted MFS family arabinose efflux permease